MKSLATRLSWRGLLFTSLVLSLGACSTPSHRGEEAELRLRIGTSYFNRANYPAAMSELLMAEELDPKNPIVQNNLGLVFFMREKYEEAAKHLEKAVSLAPSYTEARNNYGRVLTELTRYDQAIKELLVVVADLTYQEPAKGWVNLGMAHFRKGDFKKAKDALNEAIRLDRDSCLGQTLYGRTELELGQLNVAAQILDNAVVICQTNSFDEPRYFSGLTYYKLGKTSSAIARMEEVIKLFPQGRYAKKAESLLKLMK